MIRIDSYLRWMLGILVLIPFFLSASFSEFMAKVDAEDDPKKKIEILKKFERSDLGYIETYEPFLTVGQKLLEISQKHNDREGIARALFFLAFGYEKTRVPEKGVEYYFQARQAYQQIGNQQMLSQINRNLGHIFLFFYSDYRKAEEYYQKALLISKEADNQVEIARNLNNLGNLSFLLGDAEKSIAYMLEAVKVIESTKIELQAPTIYFTTAEIYLELRDLERSQLYLQKAAKLYERLNSWEKVPDVLFLQARIEQRKGNLKKAIDLYSRAEKYWLKYRNQFKLGDLYKEEGDALLSIEDYREAEKAYQKSLELKKEINDLKGQCIGLNSLGALCQKELKNEQAINYYQLARQIAEKNGFKTELIRSLEGLVESYSAIEQKEKELELRRKLDSVRRQDFQNSVSLNILKIIERYEGERKRSEVELARRRVYLAIFCYSLLLLVLLLLGSLVIKRYKRVVSYTKSELDVREAEIATQRKMLDELKNRLEEIRRLESKAKYSHSHLSEEEALRLLQSFLKLIEEERIYVDSSLSLRKVARRLKTNSAYLSQIINLYLGKSFKTLINELRIEEAKKLIIDQGDSLKEICYEVGFNSKGSFYSAFKKMTGKTPKEYRAEIKEKKENKKRDSGF